MKATPILLAVLIPVALVVASEKATVPIPKREVLRGRVIADVASLAFGVGVGPKWTSFIFAVETPNGKVIPVRIAYAFYKREDLPPEPFWDYSQLYDLTLKREPACDTNVQTISFEKNVDEHGTQLPPTFILRFAKHAQAHSLSPETVLPCYVLWYGQYKRVESTAPR